MLLVVSLLNFLVGIAVVGGAAFAIYSLTK
jgi:hypothetical protein